MKCRRKIKTRFKENIKSYKNESKVVCFAEVLEEEHVPKEMNDCTKFYITVARVNG